MVGDGGGRRVSGPDQCRSAVGDTQSGRTDDGQAAVGEMLLGRQVGYA